MALILAIESDRRQANQLTAIVRGKLHAELVLGETAEGALERLGDRVPDLILTSALLSPKDEQALGERLRRLNGVAAHVQTLTLPMFAGTAAPAAGSGRGMLSALLGDRGQGASPDGCDPTVFAEQCREYLRRATAEREARQRTHADDRIEPPAEPASIVAAVAALEPPLVIEEPAVVVAPEPQAAPHGEIADEHDEEMTVDIDLSDLLVDSGESLEASAAFNPADDAQEPAVYELSPEALEVAEREPEPEPAPEPQVHAPYAATPAEELPAEAPPAEEEFDDWQQVIDALKRESARVRLPRDHKPPAAERPLDAAAPAAAVPPKPKADAQRPRRQAKALQDEWGMFDPTQAGMAALYERLEELTRDEEKPKSA